MDVATLQVGQPLKLNRQPTDLVALARQAVAALQTTSPRHDLSLVSGVAELTGSWDPLRLERLLGNLLSNAVKYSPGGGRVFVTVGRDENVATLSVTDQGVGIPAADLPRLFERFYRATNVEHRIAGTGMGLYGARQIAELHGGTIAVESVEGVGSTFTVRLPVE